MRRGRVKPPPGPAPAPPPPSVRHSWNLAPKDAIRLQAALSRKLRFSPLRNRPKTIAGADISHPLHGRGGVAGVVVLTFPGLEIVEESFVAGELRFPYVPGLLSFREGPLLEEAFSGLKKRPDLVIFDGQGVAHPRGLGVASHMGLRLGVRAIGCAKSCLWGEAEEPGAERGSWRPLRSPHGAVIGAVLRTRTGVKPIYVSSGHRIDLEGAVRWVLAVSPKFRIPEPIRLAHRRTNEERSRLGLA